MIDRVGAGFLGPYGNTWIETPHWNRLAAESLLFETALADSPDLATLFRSYWRGLHAMQPAANSPSLAALLRETAIGSALLTDEPQLGGGPAFDAFDEQLVIEHPPAEHPAETQMARLFAAAMDWLEDAESPFALWVHSRGMSGDWDAPLDFRNRFAEDGDPLPPEFLTPPCRTLAADADPDEILGLTHAYAGQIALLDECLGAFLDHFSELPNAADTLLIVTSPRGFPLGEHGRVGDPGDDLHGELLHVPLLLRFPTGAHAAARELAIVQPPDVFATIVHWLELPAPRGIWGQSLLRLADGEVQPGRNRAAAIAGTHRALRTPAWFLHFSEDGPRQLYTKPDDRWEINEVADRCRQVTVDLEQSLRDFETAAASGNPAALPELDQSLVAGTE